MSRLAIAFNVVVMIANYYGLPKESSESTCSNTPSSTDNTISEHITTRAESTMLATSRHDNCIIAIYTRVLTTTLIAIQHKPDFCNTDKHLENRNAVECPVIFYPNRGTRRRAAPLDVGRGGNTLH